MAAQKITQSSAKLERWREIRELDRRAMPLIRQGLGVKMAYESALSGVAFDIAQNEDEPAQEEGDGDTG